LKTVSCDINTNPKRFDSLVLFDKTKSKCCKFFFVQQKQDSREFHFYLESVEMLSVFVFTAKRMVKGAATLTSFAIESLAAQLDRGCL